jgi:hypothetical protein
MILMNNFTRLYFLLQLLLTGVIGVYAQSPGIIVRPAGGPYSIILDPDQNGFTSKTGSGFITNDIGAAYSEIPYKIVPPVIIEPTGDIATGPSGGFTDIVKTTDNSGFYMYYDGVNLLFRLRALASHFAPGREADRHRAARVLWAGVHGITSLSTADKLSVVTAETAGRLVDDLIGTYVKGLRAPD